MTSRVVVKLRQDNVDKFIGDVTYEFARIFGADVREKARASLKVAKRISPGEATPEVRARYNRYVAERRAALRRVRLGRADKLPKSLEAKPSKAVVWSRELNKMVPLLPQRTADHGDPPLLHAKNRYLRRLIKFDIKQRRFGRSRIVRNVIIGPEIVGTKSEEGTPRILEYGRRRGSKGNPYMRPAFAKSLKRIDRMLVRASAKARSRSRRR